MMAFMPAGEKAKKPIYLNTAYSFRERATDLVSRMTPEEKQSQLGNTMPPIPRLGINHYDVWGEALHGIMGRNSNIKAATEIQYIVLNPNAFPSTRNPIPKRKALIIRYE